MDKQKRKFCTPGVHQDILMQLASIMKAIKVQYEHMDPDLCWPVTANAHAHRLKQYRYM